jgi:hypothetical protein
MSRRKAPPRGLPPRHPTRMAELTATLGHRYFVDYDGPRDEDGFLGFDMVHGIRDRETGRFDSRPGMTRSALYAEVAQLNAGLPVSAVAQGIGRKPRLLSPAVRWVEFLIDFEPTRAELNGALAEGRKLSMEYVRELMTYRNARTHVDLGRFPVEKLGLQKLPARESDKEQRLLESVAKQLERVLGIGRKRE